MKSSSKAGLDRPLSRAFTVTLGVLACLALAAASIPARAFHFPWDQAHDTTDWDDPTDPGPCREPGCDECDSTNSPVYLPTGHFIWSERDARITGRPGLEVTRVYNSHDPRDGMFGRGWTGGCEPNALEVADTASMMAPDGTPDVVATSALIVRARDGKRYTFDRDANGTYVAPVGHYEQVARLPDGGTELAFPDGSRQSFNAAGRLTGESIAGSTPTRYEYSTDGRLTRVVDPAGRSLSFSYDARGRADTIVDHAGQAWRYGYDAAGNLTSVVNPAGGARTYVYEAFTPPGDAFVYQHLVRVTDEAGVLVSQIVYAGERVQSYSVGENVYTYTHNAAQKTVVRTDSVGSQWTYTYSDAGKTTSLRYPSGANTARTYDASGRLTQFVDALKKAWSWSYDDRGHLTSETNPAGARSNWEFAGNAAMPTRAISASGRITSAEYDAHGNLSSVVDPAGAQTSIGWSPTGSPATLRDAQGRVTTLQSDQAGLPISVTDSVGRTSSIANDPQGRVVEVSDSRGNAVRIERDALGRVTALVQASGLRTSFSYDAAGRTRSVIDPAGKATSYEYDAFGRPSARVMSDGRRYTYTYRADNLIATLTRPGGIVESYSYDAGKRLIASSANNDRVNFSYTLRDELASVSNGVGTVSYVYDDVGRVVSETSAGRQTQYRYSVDGELTAWTLNGNTNEFALDQRGQLSALTAPEGTYRFEYDALGRRTSLVYPNGTRATYSFDARDQLGSLDYSGPFSESLKYGYDDLGVITSVNSTQDSWTYGYDADQQLVSANDGVARNYAYDPSGNRTGEGRVYDGANRLLEDANYTFTYDANGRLSQKTAKIGGAHTDYAWNDWDQLLSVRSFSDGTSTVASETLSYTYGPLGLRWSASRNGVTERYAYVGSDRVLTFDGNGNVVDRGTFGPNVDEPLALNGLGGTRFLHADHLGSIIGASSAAASLGRYRYSPYGESLSAPPGVANPYRFTAREFERDDLYYYRARYYDPTLGRFLSEDPLGLNGGDTNLYRYAGNNPVHIKDPSGQLIWLVPVVWAGIELGLAVYDAYDTVSTILDPCASAGEKWLAGGLWVAGALLPGGGYSKLDDLARWRRRVPCGCFAEGTLVDTIEGKRPIETIERGDLVLARDPQTGATDYKPVTDIQIKQDSPLFAVDVSPPGAHAAETLVTTPGHPFWVDGTGWQPAAAVQAGDALATSASALVAYGGAGTPAPSAHVQSRHLLSEHATVYNLTVDDFHTYFVGEAGILVHNNSPCNLVYRATNAAGETTYVGITNNLDRRAAEHLRDSGRVIEEVMSGLGRADARAVEQALIELHGLSKNGGSLANKINSIASSNPSYAAQLERGFELLQSMGY